MKNWYYKEGQTVYLHGDREPWVVKTVGPYSGEMRLHCDATNSDRIYNQEELKAVDVDYCGPAAEGICQHIEPVRPEYVYKQDATLTLKLAIEFVANIAELKDEERKVITHLIQTQTNPAITTITTKEQTFGSD